MTYFQAVRLYSLFECALFASLLVVWIGHIDEQAEFVLGLSHGIGWILLCVVVAIGCRRRVFPWWLLGASVSPVGPLGSTIGLELLARRGRGARRVA